MEYAPKGMPKEKESLTQYPTHIAVQDYHFEIGKVPKETRQQGRAVPLIRLFCKSNGKCGI